MVLRPTVLAVLIASLGFAQPLEQDFAQPPDSAKPHTWWHWMNGMVTREGITRDLTEMKKVGLGGAQMFHVTDGIPPGPVGYMTPQWREMVKHAVAEADRLGLELCIHNCAGWSSSGGPWVDAEHAMQILTWTEQLAQGPAPSVGKLARPPTRRDHYRDIAVLAFPTPPAERRGIAEATPEIAVTTAGQDAKRVIDGDRTTHIRLRKPSRTRPQSITFTFAEPFPAQTLTLIPGPGRNAHGGKIQVSDDGKTFRTLRAFRIPSTGITQSPLATCFPITTARHWRIAFTRPDSKSGGVVIAEVMLDSSSRIDNWPAKAGFLRGGASMSPPATPDSCIPVSQVQDISKHLTADGTLNWPVPAGRWTILRIGHTPTGKENHPAPDEGRGLECDKLSREAAQQHWDGMMAKVIDDIGPRAGRVLNNVLVDSYEVGCQNWTPGFREEFARRRSYDPLPYLPAMLGRVVGDTGTSERFLWDVRKTIAELFHENYFGFFQEMAHKHGMVLSVEGYGNGNFDNLVASGIGDIPMSEFWAGRGGSNHGSRMAASAAHVWGRKYVGAEAFTADSAAGGWRQHPYSMKALGDFIFTGGVNRFIFHRYAHQPWLDRLPGMTMGPHGFHFDWTNTWWQQAPAWTTYLARCQHLLQSGQFVADFCYYVGEDSPGNSLDGGGLKPALPPGFSQDNCASDALLSRFTVKNGRLVVPSGMSYRVLVLPDHRTMTPAILRKVRDLLMAGGTIIGPKPERSPSLADLGKGDAELQRLATELWGNCDGKTITSRQVGKGMLYWNHPMQQILAASNLVPDALFTSTDAPRISWIHRRIDQTDAYFVSNQNRKTQVVDARFRVTGRAPELWHPDTGKTELAPIYRRDGEHTVVSLLLQPHDSVFVVFRRQATTNQVVAATHAGKPLQRPIVDVAPKLEIRRAIYGVLASTGMDGMVDVTTLLRKRVKNNQLQVVAGNSLAGDPASQIRKKMVVEYKLDGKPLKATVDENQTLRLPPKGQTGKLVIRRAVYGDIPEGGIKPPRNDQTRDVTKVLREQIRNGQLAIKASNELAGDPAVHVPKQLRVEYAVDGAVDTITISENSMLELPLGQPPAWSPGELSIANDTLRLTAWEPGQVALQYADGKTKQLTVPAPPADIALAGPWLVSFPTDLGAPPQVTLPRLISLSDHEQDGVRHCSGTAIYELVFGLPADGLKPGLRATLDLGNVQVIAEPTLNGKPLGTFWKPPFRINVTDSLKAGQNRLRVRVTNLWVNRLIGDADKPDYREWAGARLKSWPEDALKSTPPPDTGRITWTTWQHYNATDPLLPSGLIGPVRLRFAHRIPIPAP